MIIHYTNDDDLYSLSYELCGWQRAPLIRRGALLLYSLFAFSA